jgi:hypothetical protein
MVFALTIDWPKLPSLRIPWPDVLELTEEDARELWTRLERLQKKTAKAYQKGNRYRSFKR